MKSVKGYVVFYNNRSYPYGCILFIDTYLGKFKNKSCICSLVSCQKNSCFPNLVQGVAGLVHARKVIDMYTFILCGAAIDACDVVKSYGKTKIVGL